MIGVIVTFQYATDFDETKLQAIAERAQQKFVGLPGLRSKAFTIDVENRRAENFYLWESPEAATGFFTPQLADGVTALYGVRPAIRFVQVAAVVDNGLASSAAPASAV
jgi:hypothetical protein